MHGTSWVSDQGIRVNTAVIKLRESERILMATNTYSSSPENIQGGIVRFYALFKPR